MPRARDTTLTTERQSMSYSFVIDTFAWVEYLIGSTRGRSAKKYIESGKAGTPTIVLVELTKWFLREVEARRRTLMEMNNAFEFIRATTLSVDLDERLAKTAGETDFVMKKRIQDWPMADSIVYATAKTAGATVVTGDAHFKLLENVTML
jgi:predicted nucleic acid-binding protein